jgi:hypothetical protein
MDQHGSRSLFHIIGDEFFPAYSVVTDGAVAADSGRYLFLPIQAIYSAIDQGEQR